jgi:acyl-CoA thioesterase YciA
MRHSQGLPEGRDPVLKVPATPAHTNAGGDIFGGWLMSQIDIAGSIPAVLRARGRVVTASVKSLHFLKPVLVGDLISIYAEISHVGRSSMTVGVEAYAQRNAKAPECVKVSVAELVYVAVDGNGRPHPVGPE